jgi:hypothetical protein
MKRKHVSQPFEWRDGDDGWGDEPELEHDDFNAQNTVHYQPQPQAEEKQARARRAPFVDDEPRVPCHEHFIAQYNTIANQRYPLELVADLADGDDEDDNDSSRDASEPGQQLATARDLFGDLFTSSPPPSGADARQTNRPRKQTRTPQMTTPYDKRTRPECFMCAYGNMYHDGIEAKHVCELNRIMDQYGGCDNTELAQMLVLYYDRFVYRPHSGMSRFSVQVALEHIEQHTRDAVIYLGESVKLLLEIRFGLANIIFKQSGRHDKDALSGFVQIQRLLNTQMTMKPENMIFNFGKSAEDTRRMGQRFNFMEVFKQKKERQERSWRTEQQAGDGADDLFDI